MFKWEAESKVVTELIIVIEPHIIDKAKTSVTLKDLGYKGMDNLLNNNEDAIADKLIENNEPMSKKLIFKNLKQ